MGFLADRPPQLDVVIPVHDRERLVPRSVGALVAFLRDHVTLRCRVLITDDASTHRTAEVAGELAEEHPEVAYVRMPREGRGGALKSAWVASPADYVAHLDVGFLANLTALPRMLELLRGGCHVVVGSRLSEDTGDTGSLGWEILSRGYNLLVRLLFGTRFTDVQCGFKGLDRETVRCLVPHVEDREWFFDTELLVLAGRSGRRIGEVPVEWIEDAKPHAPRLRALRDALVALVRLRWRLAAALGALGEGARPTP